MGIRFCYNNLVDTADITASDEEITLPAENLKDFRLGCKYRSTTTSIEIEFNLGGLQTINALAILAHNISDQVSVLKWQHKSLVGDSYVDYVDLLDPEGGGGSYNAYSDDKIIWFPASVSKGFLNLVITDTQNIDGYIEIGRIFVGSYFEPSNDAESHIEIETNDLSDQTNALDGTEYFNIKSLRDTANLNFPLVENDDQGVDDYQTFKDMYELVGQHQDMIISLYPDRGSVNDNRYRYLKNYTYYCRFINNFKTVPLEEIKNRLNLKLREII